MFHRPSRNDTADQLYGIGLRGDTGYRAHSSDKTKTRRKCTVDDLHLALGFSFITVTTNEDLFTLSPLAPSGQVET